MPNGQCGSDCESYSSGFPEQVASLAPNVVSGLLASDMYRSYHSLPVSDSAKYFLVSVREMSAPEKSVVKKRALKSLVKWYDHFNDDMFRDVVLSDEFTFPELEAREHFYRITFNDYHHRVYEVSVCPVLSKEGVQEGDMVRMFLVPPQLPHASKRLTDSHYPADVANIACCNTLFTLKKKQRGFEDGDFDEREKMLTRGGEKKSEIVFIPAYWDFAFRSQGGNENACGDVIIPQILSRLWYLRDCICEPARYNLVQLTSTSYIGFIENVAGFNVLFQVNCSMRMPVLKSFFPNMMKYVPHNWRKPLALAVPIEKRKYRQVASLNKETKVWVSVSVNELAPIFEAVKHRDRNGTKALVSRVMSYVDNKVSTMYNLINERKMRDKVESIQLGLKVFAQNLGPTPVPPYSGMYKLRISEAAINWGSTVEQLVKSDNGKRVMREIEPYKILEVLPRLATDSSVFQRGAE
eukprot:1282502-Rhodomonas_salina.3